MAQYVDQKGFRICTAPGNNADPDDLDPNYHIWSAANVDVIDIAKGQKLFVRFLLVNTGDDNMPLGELTFEYDNDNSPATTTQITTTSDVLRIVNDPYDIIYNGLTLVKNLITGAAGDINYGRYIDNFDSFGGGIGLGFGSWIEHQVCIEFRPDAIGGQDYYIFIKNAGYGDNQLDSYTKVPKITLAVTVDIDQAHWRILDDDAAGPNGDPDDCTPLAAVDTAHEIEKETPFHVRIQATNEGTENASTTWQLMYGLESDGSDAVLVGTALGGTIQVESVAGSVLDGAASTADDLVYDNTGGFTWQPGKFDEGDGITAALALADTFYTDFQFCVQFTPLAAAGTKYYFRLYRNEAEIQSYDGGGAEVTALAVDIDQVHWRIFDDDAAGAPNGDPDGCTPLAAVDTGCMIERETPFHLRIQATNDGDANPSTTWQLFYGLESDGSDAVLVGAALGGDIQVDSVAGSVLDGADPDDDDLVFDNTGSYTWQNGEFDEVDGITTALALGDTFYTDFQFCIQFTSLADPGTKYYFRLYRNGAPLESYSAAWAEVIVVPTDIDQAHWRILDDDAGGAPFGNPDDCTPLATVDTAHEIEKETPFHVRIQATNDGNANASTTWQLMYGLESDGSDAVLVGAALSGTIQVESILGTAEDNQNLGQSDLVYDNTGNYTWQDGEFDEGDGATQALVLGDTFYTDFQFCVQFTPLANAGHLYYFRLYRNGAEIESYTCPSSAAVVAVTASAVSGPKGPLGHPFNGPFRGPI